VAYTDSLKKEGHSAKVLWLTPVILATQEEETRRIVVPGQHGQKVHKTLTATE
jgi:hypothetical protein